MLDQVLEHPDLPSYTIDHDNVLRLALADLMLARHEPQGELIKLQIELFKAARSPLHAQQIDQGKLAGRIKDLLAEHRAGWAAGVAPYVGGFRFRRGMIGEVELSAQQFLDRAADLYRAAPITMVEITSGGREHMAELARSPQLGRLRSLEIKLQHLGDDEIATLAASPNVANLIALNLEGNDVGERGVWALAESPRLQSLVFVRLYGNRADPTAVETRSDSWTAGAERALPPLGEEIERRVGFRAWLHSDMMQTPDLEAAMSQTSLEWGAARR